MSSTNTPNMNLIVPGIGTEASPTWGQDINNSFNIIDAHNHSPGSGVQITPDGLNINTAFTINNNFITNAAGLTFAAQGSTPANSTIYESGNDLYFVDGLGNNVRITQSGAVAGTPGSISNLTSPASASYVAGSSTFVWQSAASTAANMDAASYLMRNISPNSTYALTLQPPASLAANYSITLPANPGALSGTSFMTLDASGVMATGPLVSGGITASNIANGTITGTQIATNVSLNNAGAGWPNVGGLNIMVNNTNPGPGLPLCIVRGRVAANGTILSGEGFTVNHVFTGIYDITFTNPFFDVPSVTVTASGTINTAVLGSTTTSFASILMYSTGSSVVAQNAAFSFIAVGGL